MIFLELFWGFFRVGLFAFGGAYGAIPLIREIVMSYGWLDDEMLTYMIAVSESTPGPIMVNLATYIGSSQAGIAGAALATVAVILPAFAVVILIVVLLRNLLNNGYVQAVLHGMTPSVIGIILATGIFMVVRNCFPSGSGTIPDIRAIAITAGLAVICFGYRVIRKKGFSPILLILISAVAGMIVYS